MINANELRIGNKVYFNLMQEVRIITISYHEIRYAAIHKTNTYEPIPLTPEILEKAGFKELGKAYNLTVRWFEIEFPDTSQKLSVNLDESAFCIGDSDYDKEILFRSKMEVHTLQNTYYALTEKELEINL